MSIDDAYNKGIDTDMRMHNQKRDDPDKDLEKELSNYSYQFVHKIMDAIERGVPTSRINEIHNSMKLEIHTVLRDRCTDALKYYKRQSEIFKDITGDDFESYQEVLRSKD